MKPLRKRLSRLESRYSAQLFYKARLSLAAGSQRDLVILKSTCNWVMQLSHCLLQVGEPLLTPLGLKASVLGVK